MRRAFFGRAPAFVVNLGGGDVAVTEELLNRLLSPQLGEPFFEPGCALFKRLLCLINNTVHVEKPVIHPIVPSRVGESLTDVRGHSPKQN